MSNFNEIVFSYATYLSKATYSTSLTFNCGTKNALSTFTFGTARASDDTDPALDGLCFIQSSAKSLTFNGMQPDSTINLMGGVDALTTAFNFNAVKNLNIHFTTDKAVNMAFGKVGMSSAETLIITAKTGNNTANSIGISNLTSTMLRLIKLVDTDTKDNAAITLNGTLASNSLLDFSGFNGSVTLTDNVGAATVSLGATRGNAISLRPPAADETTQLPASIVSYTSATPGAGDTIAQFDVAQDKLRFTAGLSGSIRFATDGAGTTSVFVGASDIPAVTLPSTTGFSASNIIFTA